MIPHQVSELCITAPSICGGRDEMPTATNENPCSLMPYHLTGDVRAMILPWFTMVASRRIFLLVSGFHTSYELHSRRMIRSFDLISAVPGKGLVRSPHFLHLHMAVQQYSSCIAWHALVA